MRNVILGSLILVNSLFLLNPPAYASNPTKFDDVLQVYVTMGHYSKRELVISGKVNGSNDISTHTIVDADDKDLHFVFEFCKEAALTALKSKDYLLYLVDMGPDNTIVQFTKCILQKKPLPTP